MMMRLVNDSETITAGRGLHALLEHTRRTGTVSLALGQSGHGKTTLLRACCLEASAGQLESRPVLLHRAEVVNTPRSVLRALLRSLDMECKGRTDEAFSMLTAEMRLRGVEAIVVDDAQRLARHSLDMLRGLHERTHMGLVLCGAPRLREQLVARCPELAHRVVAVHVMAAVEGDDAYALIREQPLLQRRQFDEQVAISRVIVEGAHGNLRRMTQLLDEAQRRARAGHRALSPRLLRLVADELPDRTLDLPRGA